MKTATKESSARSSNEPKTPTQLLRADHKKVKHLFAEFEKTENPQKMLEIFETVAKELEVHTKVEEDIFYPAAEKLIKDEELVDEAFEEHHVVDVLIAELKKLNIHDSEQKKTFRAKFTVLMENVKHHIEEEEGDMFPKFDKTKADKTSILEQMKSEKKVLSEKY